MRQYQHSVRAGETPFRTSDARLSLPLLMTERGFSGIAAQIPMFSS